jgi:ribokinase
VEGFIRDGIRVHHVVRDKRAPSGIALIFVAPDGENSIAVAPGANARLSPKDIRRAVNTITQADILVLQLEIPTETVTEAAKLASKAGVPVILNPAPAQPLPDRLLRCITVLTPNETEAELLTGITIRRKSDMKRAAEALLERGIRAVLMTLGARGVFAATGEKMEVVPAFKVKPVDTTAAGDAFSGALAVALAEKRPLFEAVRFAEAAAALSTTKPGAQPSLPKRKEIERFMG